MLAVFISIITICNGIKVKITKYQLRKQIGLALNKNHRYYILGFVVLSPKIVLDFRARILKKIRFFFPDFDSS